MDRASNPHAMGTYPQTEICPDCGRPIHLTRVGRAQRPPFDSTGTVGRAVRGPLADWRSRTERK
jgi:hypothetical protein